MNSRVTTLSDCGMLSRGVLILVAADVLLANTPTVPVRASCVWLAGQAAFIAALASGALGGGADGGDGAIGGRALSCEVCTVDLERGFERGASTVTCGNVAVSGCAGVSAGDEDVSDCAEGACAGASGGGAGSAAAEGGAGSVAVGEGAGWAGAAAGGVAG